MCTALLSIDDNGRVLLVGVRDEMLARAWEPPARHWPGLPGLVGGRDLQAGGTWLAVSPDDRRVACVLNGRGQQALATTRRSRGGLPLRAALGKPLDRSALTGLDPFHLLVAEPGRATIQSWDGRDLLDRELDPGLHLAVNSGLASDLHPPRPPSANPPSVNPGAGSTSAENGRARELARIAYFLPRFTQAARPDPRPGQPIPDAWGEWFPLINGAGLPTDDQRALIVRHDFGDGRVWGSGSISLVALSPTGLRYDFAASPGDPSAWYPVALEPESTASPSS
jgi:hypothetical protein